MSAFNEIPIISQEWLKTSKFFTNEKLTTNLTEYFKKLEEFVNQYQ